MTEVKPYEAILNTAYDNLEDGNVEGAQAALQGASDVPIEDQENCLLESAIKLCIAIDCDDSENTTGKAQRIGVVGAFYDGWIPKALLQKCIHILEETRAKNKVNTAIDKSLGLLNYYGRIYGEEFDNEAIRYLGFVISEEDPAQEVNDPVTGIETGMPLATLYEILVELFILKQQWVDAALYAKRALKIDGHEASYDCHLALAIEKQRAMKYEEAIRILDAAPIKPERGRINFAGEIKVTCAVYAGRDEDALIYLKEWKELAAEQDLDVENNEGYLSLKAYALKGLSRFDDAIECAEACLELNEKNIVARDALVSALGGLGRLAEAKQNVDWVIEKEIPHDIFFSEPAARVYWNLASQAAKEHQQFEVVDGMYSYACHILCGFGTDLSNAHFPIAFGTYNAIGRDWSAYIYNRYLALREAGRHEEALRLLEDKLDQIPEPIGVYAGLAEIYTDIARNTRSREHADLARGYARQLGELQPDEGDDQMVAKIFTMLEGI